MSNGSNAAADSIGRSVYTGCISLNDVFVVRNARRRFKRTSIRLSNSEAVWIFLSFFIAFAVIYLFARVLLLIPGMGDFVSPILLAVILGLPTGWLLGRKIARLSPYRSVSGEGLSEYLWVMNDKKGLIFGRLIGRNVATSICRTTASGKEQYVNCVEWIGTARAPMFPHEDQSQHNRYVEVDLQPRSKPIEWIDYVRRRDLMVDQHIEEKRRRHGASAHHHSS